MNSREAFSTFEQSKALQSPSLLLLFLSTLPLFTVKKKPYTSCLISFRHEGIQVLASSSVTRVCFLLFTLQKDRLIIFTPWDLFFIFTVYWSYSYASWLPVGQYLWSTARLLSKLLCLPFYLLNHSFFMHTSYYPSNTLRYYLIQTSPLQVRTQN